MASVLPDIIDRLKALITGAYTPDLAIANGEFTHVSHIVYGTLPQALKKPYPFEIEVGATRHPPAGPTTLASSQRWSETDVTVRVLYASYPERELHREKQIQRGVYALRRTLSDEASWRSLTGWSNCDLLDIEKLEAPIPGDLEYGDFGAAWVVQVPMVVTYREDYTT